MKRFVTFFCFIFSLLDGIDANKTEGGNGISEIPANSNFAIYNEYVNFLRNEEDISFSTSTLDLTNSKKSDLSSSLNNLETFEEQEQPQRIQLQLQKEIYSKYALSNNEPITFTIHLPQCNLNQVHIKAREVADFTLGGFGSYLTTEELRALTRCENHKENVAFVRHWLEDSFENKSIDSSVFEKRIQPNNVFQGGKEDNIDKTFKTTTNEQQDIYRVEEFSTMLKVDTTILGLKTLFPTKQFMKIPQNTEGVGVYGIKVIAKNIVSNVEESTNEGAERKLVDKKEVNSSKDYLEIPEALKGRITMITGLTQSNMKMDLRSHYHHSPEKTKRNLKVNRNEYVEQDSLKKEEEGEKSYLESQNPYFNMHYNLIPDQKDEKKKKQLEKYAEAEVDVESGTSQDRNGEDKEEENKVNYEPFVPETVPALLEKMYNKPPETVRYDGYSHGILTYNDDTFNRKDIYTAAELMGTSDIARNPVILENNAEDNPDMETTMDIEYISLLGAGVPTTAFLTPNYGGTLDMLQYILNHDELLPSGGGPYVWSMSWGFPAPLLYLLAGDGTSSADYVKACEDLFAQLASLGVTVIVASGDDGAVEANPACPVNSSWPLFFNDKPFMPMESTKCSTFQIKAPSGKTCYIPTAYKGITSMDMDIAGLQCYEVFGECPSIFTSEIKNLILPMNSEEENMENEDQCEINGDIVDGALFLITSTCQCSSNPKIIKEMNGCTISPFEFDKSVNGQMFWTAYPGSSAYVTSVGASAVNPFAEPSGIDEIAAYSFNGGGGFDAFIPRPWYQKADFTTVVDDYVELPDGEGPPNADYFQALNRGIPDVSAIAENVVVYIAGQTILTQGTSASAPMIAGIVSVLNAKRMIAGLPAIGQLNPHLYRMQATDPNSFHKLNRFLLEFQGGLSQDGSNSLALHYGVAYVCEHGFNSTNKVGWDGVTGLGTPKFDMWENYFLDESLSNPQEGRKQKRKLGRKNLRI